MREEGDSSNTGSPVGGAHASTGNREDQHLGQSLRGSSDLHAWTDSACYLVRRPDDRLQLTVEHRSAPAPDPLLLRLSGGGDQPLSLLVESADAPPPPLARGGPRRSPQRSPAALQDRPAPTPNACASTTLVSVSPSKLSNDAASPSAAPTAGTCRHDPHRPLPPCSHPATVPLFHPFRSTHALGTERPPPHSASSILQPTSARGAQRNTFQAGARLHP